LINNGKLKSLFVTPAIVTSTILFIYSTVRALAGDPDWLGWVGAAIAALPMPILMGRLMLTATARTAENLPVLLFFSLAGTALVTWELYFEGTAAMLALICAITATAIIFLYVFWYSHFGRHENARLNVGSKLPEFTLKDMDGSTFRSTELSGNPAVLLFYRGNWCPLCMAQIGELVDRYQQMDDLDIAVCLISPQSEGHSQALARKHDVPFRFLVDHENKVAESLDIAVKSGVPAGVPGGYNPDTVMPTLIVTNAAGTIVFSDQTDNYRVRPEPDIFLAILRRARAMNS
jgi:peroxiredoxin